MFGFRNFTGFTFIGKIGKATLEFSAGIVEEISFNITSSASTELAEIPFDNNLNFISKDQIIKTATVAVNSKILGSNLFTIIAGATPNIFI